MKTQSGTPAAAQAESLPVRWTVGLFGRLRLLRDGQTVKVLSDTREDVLLAFLAAQPEKSHPRRQIALLFWPNHDPSEGLKRLSYVLWRLQQSLKAEGLEEAIWADRNTLRLDPRIGTDVLRFRQCFVEAARRTNPADRRRWLEEAIELYGDGLLPSLQGSWLDPERARVNQLVDEAKQLLDSSGPTDEAGDRAVTDGSLPKTEVVATQGPESTSESPRNTAEARKQVLALAEQAGPKLSGSDRQFWLARLDAEKPNIDAVLERVVVAHARSFGLQLVVALRPYWEARELMDEGIWYLEQLLAQPEESPAQLEAAAFNTIGALAMRQSKLDKAQRNFEAALPLWKMAHDEAGEMRCLANIGAVAQAVGDYELARRVQFDATFLARLHGTSRDLAGLLSNAALTAIKLDDNETARFYLLDALELARQDGDLGKVAFVKLTLASVELSYGRADSAARHVNDVLDQIRDSADKRQESLALRILGQVAGVRKQFDAAESYLVSSLAAARIVRDHHEAGQALWSLGEVRQSAGELEKARAALTEAEVLLNLSGDVESARRIRVQLDSLRSAGNLTGDTTVQSAANPDLLET